MSGPPPPFPSEKKYGSAVPLYWYTISIIFIWTNQTFVNQMNSSVLFRLLFTFGRGTAMQTPPDPPYFPELGASPRARGYLR